MVDHPPLRLAVFDCDGTLVDSQANICRAMVATFSGAGLVPPTSAATRAIVGLSLVEAMQVLLPDGEDATHRRMALDYKAAFHAMRTNATLDDEPLFDGIADVLRALAEDGWLLGVATGKSDRGLAHVIERHALGGLFATLQTADRHPSKPDPAMLFAAMAEVGAVPAHTAMIGDTSYDMTMARAGGAKAVGVAWGYHDVAELIDGGAEMVAREVADLPGLLVSA